MQTKEYFTTTEKLVVSRAIDIYGIENEASVTKYIAAMYSYIHPNRWKEIYRSVLNAYKEHGYLSPVDFCEDLRFETAKRIYMEKVELRTRLLEGDDVSYPEYEARYDWNIGDIEGVTGRLSSQAEEFTDNRQLYSTIDPKIIRQHVEAMSKQQNEPRSSISGFENPMETKEESAMVMNKDKKRFYYKMTDEERELDDFIDKVEEEDYNRPAQGIVIPNNLRGKYPAMKTTLLGAEQSKDPKKADAGPSENIRAMNLGEQYRYIMRKVVNTRKQAKDKTLWKQELRTIIRYYISSIGMAKELERIDISIKDNNMTHVVLSILMLLQEVINKTKDEGLITRCANFKKNLASFNDYYRR